MANKYKYLIFRVKPYETGETVAQVDVSHLKRKGIEQKWIELSEKFPSTGFDFSLAGRSHPMSVFIKEEFVQK